VGELTDRDLREAAAEAGISPSELRDALVKRDGTAPVVHDVGGSLVAAPRRGNTVLFAEGRLPAEPVEALAQVRGAVERVTGASGHHHGDLEADIVDERLGLTFMVRSVADGEAGSLVRVDVDPTQARGNRVLTAMLTGTVAVGMLGVGWLFSLTSLMVGGVGMAILGGYLYSSQAGKIRAALADGQAIASQAVADVKRSTPTKALPPEGG